MSILTAQPIYYMLFTAQPIRNQVTSGGVTSYGTLTTDTALEHITLSVWLETTLQARGNEPLMHFHLLSRNNDNKIELNLKTRELVRLRPVDKTTLQTRKDGLSMITI